MQGVIDTNTVVSVAGGEVNWLLTSWPALQLSSSNRSPGKPRHSLFFFLAILIYTSGGWGCHRQEGFLPAQILCVAIMLPGVFRGRYINPMGPEAYLHHVGGGRTELTNLNQLWTTTCPNSLFPSVLGASKEGAKIGQAGDVFLSISCLPHVLCSLRPA